MSYFTRVGGPSPTSDRLMVAHDGCLPDDQFETWHLSGGRTHRRQKLPWCWAPIYGGEMRLKEGRAKRDDPAVACVYCGEVVA